MPCDRCGLPLIGALKNCECADRWDRCGAATLDWDALGVAVRMVAICNDQLRNGNMHPVEAMLEAVAWHIFHKFTIARATAETLSPIDKPTLRHGDETNT